MLRALLVMVSTLIFALVGLLIGYLAVNTGPWPNSDRLVFSYGVGPVFGAVLGFALSLFSVWLFTPTKNP
jgi:hypothetical protein